MYIPPLILVLLLLLVPGLGEAALFLGLIFGALLAVAWLVVTPTGQSILLLGFAVVIVCAIATKIYDWREDRRGDNRSDTATRLERLGEWLTRPH